MSFEQAAPAVGLRVRLELPAGMEADCALPRPMGLHAASVRVNGRAWQGQLREETDHTVVMGLPAGGVHEVYLTPLPIAAHSESPRAATAAQSTGPRMMEAAHASTSPRIGLLLALYNANVTSDWVAVANAASRIPIRVIVPVPGVVPPDPDWPPTYPSASAYRTGVAMLRAAGIQVYAYTHLRNISRKCCTCCGNLTQFEGWVERIQQAAVFDGVMLDNNDAPWSSSQPYHPDGLTRMYLPAAALVKKRGLGVWTNGPHLAHDGSLQVAASAWRPYLELSSFTTLFEAPVHEWLSYPERDFGSALQWSTDRLGGYVLDIPDNLAAAGPAINASIVKAIEQKLGWIYPTVACKHSIGPHQGSCTYAELPSYWSELVAILERLNR